MESKIVNRETLITIRETLKSRHQTVVFTNGCFDILHAGHVAYLEDARALGDVLIVGLNSDGSVHRLKGPTRPINTELNRARVMAGLQAVDYVCIFDEDTPIELIRCIQPDIHTKGGDYEPQPCLNITLLKNTEETFKSSRLDPDYRVQR